MPPRQRECLPGRRHMSLAPVIGSMLEPDVLDSVRRVARRAGREVADARRAYRQGRVEGALPTDDDGRVKIVCRRDAERRAVQLVDGRPDCFDGEHPACESCLGDLEAGVIETW